MYSWLRERFSPEATPSTRRKRSNAWLGNDNDEDGDGDGDGDETHAVAGTGTRTSTSSFAGAASGNAEVMKGRLRSFRFELLVPCVLFPCSL